MKSLPLFSFVRYVLRAMGLLNQPMSREAWLAACHFHDLSQAEVLHAVAERVRCTSEPMIVLDLDSTLYEVGPRTHQILKEWLETPESQAFKHVHKIVSRLDSKQVGYSLRDIFRTLGLPLNEHGDRSETFQAWESAKKFWAVRFFRSAYLQYDRPYPYAAEFSHRIYDLGARIVYLTGRDEPGMGEGTRERLRADGFPWGTSRTHLLLKAESSLPDLEHKLEAANWIERHGNLVASFENEPKNLVALYERFPLAMHVFVDTVSSDHEAVSCQGLYRIQGFEISE